METTVDVKKPIGLTVERAQPVTVPPSSDRGGETLPSGGRIVNHEPVHPTVEPAHSVIVPPSSDLCGEMLPSGGRNVNHDEK